MRNSIEIELMMKNLEAKYNNWIIEKDHPCIMAQTVFSQKNIIIENYKQFGVPGATEKLLKDLESYIEGYDFSSNEFQSFIAVFPESDIHNEDEFELVLWKQLSDLKRLDNHPWDPSVSRNPDDDNFSFSIGGRAFYIVGMHPESSRIARRSPYPSIAFNLHTQFEKLREMGVYHNVRDKIRERDRGVQGSVNPMLEDFGESSEARQYSGKSTGADWVCPFHQ